MYWLDIVGLCLEGVRDSWLLVLSCSIVILVFGDEPSFCPIFPGYLHFWDSFCFVCAGLFLFCFGSTSCWSGQRLAFGNRMPSDITSADQPAAPLISGRRAWDVPYFWGGVVAAARALGRVEIIVCCSYLAPIFLTLHFPAYCPARVSFNITIHIQRLSNPQW